MNSPFTSGKLDLIEIRRREKNTSTAQPLCGAAHPRRSALRVGGAGTPEPSRKLLQVVQLVQRGSLGGRCYQDLPDLAEFQSSA